MSIHSEPSQEEGTREGQGGGHSDTGVEAFSSPALSLPRADGNSLLCVEVSGDGFEPVSFSRTSSEAVY